MLIEVLVSALLVALISVGVFTGLDGANRASANERRNAQATVIAQQDEERLRGLTVAELTDLGESTHTVAENGMCVEGSTGAWKYSGAATTSCEAVSAPLKGTAYTGTVFTVTSSAQYVSASKEELTCETTGGTADYLRTTSSVTWPSVGTHAPISQSSLVAVPRAGTLLARVTNSKNEPVPGATVKVTDGTATAEQITPSSGCVIFGDLAEGNAKVEASKAGLVDENGKAVQEVQSVGISNKTLAEASFILEAPGGIKVTFVNSGGTPVDSTTFVASQTAMGSPSFDVGGKPETPAESAELGNLFPFITPPSKPNPYTVYAGDCEANNPATVGVSGATTRSVPVEPGKVESELVEVAPINIKVYKGRTVSEGELARSTSAKIVNTACKGTKANDGETIKYEHNVEIINGKLVPEYQPYAENLELCVTEEISNKYYNETAKFSNEVRTGTTPPNMYLEQKNSTNKDEC